MNRLENVYKNKQWNHIDKRFTFKKMELVNP